MKFYDGSIAKALCDLFPDIGLSKAKLLASMQERARRERREGRGEQTGER